RSRSRSARARVQRGAPRAAPGDRRGRRVKRMSATMRERFYATAADLVESDERIAMVFADIGVGRLGNAERTHADRVINVGIRERVYGRMTKQTTGPAQRITPGRRYNERRGTEATVIAAGPLLYATRKATADMDVTVLYMTMPRPFDADTLHASLAGDLVVLVEPYLAGTSSAQVAGALADIPHRIATIGVPNDEHRKYGTWQDHNAAHGLDARGIRTRILRALSRGA